MRFIAYKSLYIHTLLFSHAPRSPHSPIPTSNLLVGVEAFTCHYSLLVHVSCIMLAQASEPGVIGVFGYVKCR